MVVPTPLAMASQVDNGIRVITEPSVYVLGKQTVDGAELNRFLTDHGVSWESDSEIAAEVLTETAGRVCYMSFAKPRPGGNAAYLGHIKEVGLMVAYSNTRSGTCSSQASRGHSRTNSSGTGPVSAFRNSRSGM